jgi:hypothetical protein
VSSSYYLGLSGGVVGPGQVGAATAGVASRKMPPLRSVRWRMPGPGSLVSRLRIPRLWGKAPTFLDQLIVRKAQDHSSWLTARAASERKVRTGQAAVPS